ncbi:MAG: phenylacetate--CoA ligase [Coriobacteriales bacterium]|jgi:phenylacetate-CoA ligase|nr:phenylacetate--CoA ligase [Coriobacteriales bacterium]
MSTNVVTTKDRKDVNNPFWNEEIETLPRPQLEELQLRELKEELDWAYANSPYYKRTWDDLGIKPSDVQSLADLQKFPFIDKSTQRATQGVGSFLGELAAVNEEDVVFISSSSGSTGVPTVSPFTQQDFDEWQDVESRWFWQAGMRPQDRYIHALNFSLYVGGPDVMGAQNLGALCIWGGTLPSERLIFILKTYQPTCIWTSPSYAWYLGETCKKQGLDPKTDLSIKRIFVAGEMGGSISSTRKAIEDLWGAELFDFYGLSDIFGACAAQCHEHDGLHIAEDHILVETVDINTGEVLKPGEKGELVYTTLRKKARPLIRFRTGDIGTVDIEPCACGRTHARIHVVGRKDDMFIVSAVNVFPSDIEQVVRGMEEVTGEYTVRIYDENFTTRYEVTVEKTPGCELTYDEVSDRVKKHLKARTGVNPARVIVQAPGAIERSTHKATRVIDERDKSDK